MGVADTIRAQIEDYPRVHRTRANLAIHIAAIPLFWVGLFDLVIGLVRLSWLVALFGVAAIVISIALQGLAHRREPEPSRPFKGPADFALRLATEALVVFPRFVLTGGWLAAWRSAGSARSTD